MYCTTCKKARQGKFCNVCGTWLLMLRCPDCKMNALPDDKFCVHCGHPVEESIKKVLEAGGGK